MNHLGQWWVKVRSTSPAHAVEGGGPSLSPLSRGSNHLADRPIDLEGLAYLSYLSPTLQPYSLVSDLGTYRRASSSPQVSVGGLRWER